MYVSCYYDVTIWSSINLFPQIKNIGRFDQHEKLERKSKKQNSLVETISWSDRQFDIL